MENTSFQEESRGLPAPALFDLLSKITSLASNYRIYYKYKPNFSPPPLDAFEQDMRSLVEQYKISYGFKPTAACDQLWKRVYSLIAQKYRVIDSYGYEQGSMLSYRIAWYIYYRYVVCFNRVQ